ncbi:MAG: endolytic transglycosylase MltG, partial [Acidobacteriota bacterium]
DGERSPNSSAATLESAVLIRRMKLSANQRRAAIALGLLLIASAAATGLWLRHDLRKPRAHGFSEKPITIEPRARTSAIISKLHREGILTHELPARLYLRFFAAKARLKAGDYHFRSPISTLQVIDQIVRGDVATRQFTIPEGYNQFDIARILASLPGLKQAAPETPESALELLRKTALIADLDPTAATLEGYLFPDTYEYTATATREQLVEAMVRRFRKTYAPLMQQRGVELGMSVREVVTLASLIEKEAKVDAERELISSVFHRRLKSGTALACDPTLIYAALLIGRYRGKIYQSDLDRDSPYNTYKRAGLPPGPIASPGKRSLEAALNPAETDFLYFVVDVTKNDGSHTFSASAAAHERAVAALRQLERSQH